MSLVFDNPVQPVLALPRDLALWQQGEAIADPAARWRVYLHRLGLAALRAWVQDEVDQVMPLWPAADAVDLWQGVDGLALVLGDRRLVVILSEAIDAASLAVPQEWVDIPGWAADYYVAAQVDVDEQRLVLWGYGTYAQVKGQGRYEPSDRTYSLSADDLIQDFSVFWVAQQLEPLQPVALPELAPLSATQAERLIERLARAVEPRLEIPFELWGALLSNAAWRRQLWQRRQGIMPVDLGGWLRQVFAPGWQALGELLPQSPALGLRSAETSGTAISQGKAVWLNPPGCYLVLGVRMVTVDGNRRSISIQLFPSGEDLLPSGVTLALASPDAAEHLQTVQAGEHDNYIQLPGFRCPPGQPFRVKVQLGDAMVQEDFIS
ncbi:DUF1822 family protein [Nodosilinea sp. LEGE 07298]|uniref:DUF1822 family protein n=1 Tax=Nodosilinea sp. LEGE 07298 TaxID=2777970 RepID=UPI00187E9FE0|nr:DUF1822 family protein [Nodosilinea sp. LEGE 07298]MBE9113179.1 DUF1822 family protein [Nodosilinea sp. LEGE 07298]